MTVVKIPYNDFNLHPLINSICPNVKLNPETIRANVLKSVKLGFWFVFKVKKLIPKRNIGFSGGQIQPINILGAKLKWKKAQKKEKKNIASEIINNDIPILIPCFTFLV
jgi:hypothetical protein